MLVGRHAAPVQQVDRASRGQDVAAWGAFTVPLSVVVLFLVGAGWKVMVAVAGLGVVAFSIVWAATRMIAPADAAAGEDSPPA